MWRHVEAPAGSLAATVPLTAAIIPAAAAAFAGIGAGVRVSAGAFIVGRFALTGLRTAAGLVSALWDQVTLRIAVFLFCGHTLIGRVPAAVHGIASVLCNPEGKSTRVME